MEPTAREKFLYYTLGITPPAISREWVERDINSAGWQVRRFLQVWIGMAFGLAVVGPLLMNMPWQPWRSTVPGVLLGGLIGGAIAGVLQATVFADYLRRRAMEYYEKKWRRQLSV